MIKEKRCIYCNKTLRLNRKLNICSSCNSKNYWKEQYDNLKEELKRKDKLEDITFKDFAEKENKFETEKSELLNQLEKEKEKIKQKMCADERPLRKTFCQLEKGHQGSHQAVIFWEGKK